MKDKFVKIETAAEMTELSIETVRKWVKERRIRTYRFGRDPVLCPRMLQHESQPGKTKT